MCRRRLGGDSVELGAADEEFETRKWNLLLLVAAGKRRMEILMSRLLLGEESKVQGALGGETRGKEDRPEISVCRRGSGWHVGLQATVGQCFRWNSDM